MSDSASGMSDCQYPMPKPDDDPRFTFGLTYDVAKVLAKHGFPPVEVGADFVRLQQALFQFLYEDSGSRSDGES